MIYSHESPPNTQESNNGLFVCRSLLLFFISLISYPDIVAQDFQFSLEIANPNPVGSGARALGQGNAFIAVADDATAASWNPGGLPQLEKPEFSFALEMVAQEMRLSSSTHPESEGDDSFSLADFNYASLVFPFHLGTNMVFSLNYLRLFRFDKEMDFPINQTFATSQGPLIRNLNYDFEQEGSFAVLAPAFGLNVTRSLSLGISVNIWNDDITGSSHFKKTEVTTGKRIFRGTETDINFLEINRIEIDEGYSLVFGGLYRLNKQWAFGAVAKPAFELELNHEITVDNPLAPRDAELEMPRILGAGVAWRPHDPLTISTDVTWTDWSKYHFVQDGVKENPLTGRRSNVDELEDTFTVRLGCEFLVIRENYVLPLRCGFGYDPSPAVDDVDDFYTVNFGMGIQMFKRIDFDVAYEFRWGTNVNRDTLQGITATQDVYRHRALASMIYFF